MVLKTDMEILIDIIDVRSCVILHTHTHTHLIYLHYPLYQGGFYEVFRTVRNEICRIHGGIDE